MPELQALLQFLLMFCPKLVKGGLGLVQLGQEPGEGAAAMLVWDCEAPLLAVPSGGGLVRPPHWRGRVGGPVCLPRAWPHLRTVEGTLGRGHVSPCLTSARWRAGWGGAACPPRAQPPSARWRAWPGCVSPRLTCARCSDCPAGPGWGSDPGSGPVARGCPPGRAAPRQAPASYPPVGRPGSSSRPPAPDLAPSGAPRGQKAPQRTPPAPPRPSAARPPGAPRRGCWEAPVCGERAG